MSDRALRASLACAALATALAASGCFRGAKVDVTEAWLREHQVYRSEAFAREPYVFEVGDRSARVACRTFSQAPPRLRVSPFDLEVSQRWESAIVPLGDAERARLRAAGHDTKGPLYQHVVTLAGLKPRKRYHVLLGPPVAGTDAGTAITAGFLAPATASAGDAAGAGANAVEERGVLVRTMPDSEREPTSRDDVSFLVLGDSGTGSRAQLAVATALARSIGRPGGIAHDVDFVLHTGDLVYEEGAALDVEAVVFAPYRDLLARAPLYPVLGNHDVRSASGQPIARAFAGVDLARPWWHRVLGPVELIGLDATEASSYAGAHGRKPSGDDLRDLAGRQRRWLRGVLRQPRAPWRLVVMHHAALSAGTRHGSGRLASTLETRELRASLRPAFGAVDFFVQGHDHHYERSVPIAFGWLDDEGRLAIPASEQGRHDDLRGLARNRDVALRGRTVSIIQGSGGGRVADGPGFRIAWASLWTAFLPLGSPLWMSYLPVGFDWVNRSEPWVDRAGMAYAVTRFDVDALRARLRTWTVDPDTGRALLVDDVTYRKSD